MSSIEPHPDADRLEVLKFDFPLDWHLHADHRQVQLVTGKHYKAHSEGIWFRPGAILPGWLAEEMWVQKGIRTFEVREFPIRGVLSRGLFAGSVWRKDSEHDFEPWRFWKSSWRPGMDVSDYFGVWFRPRSSAAEQAVANREVAARENAPLGATPAVGSISDHKAGSNQ